MKPRADCLLVALLSVLAPSCGSTARPDPPGEEAEEEAEVSDLDQSVDTLRAQTCEHGIPTWTCDECRYETGIVKVPTEIVRDGLLKVAPVLRESARATLTLTGEVQFDEESIGHIRPQVEGTVGRVYVKLGQHVTKGQPLLEEESRDFGDALSAFREARSLADLATRSLDRQEQLRKDQITSEREYLSARQEAEAAEIRLQSAGEKLLRFGVKRGDLDALRDGKSITGGRLTLRSPVEGTVLFLDAVPGEVVRPEDGVAIIGDGSRLWVWTDLYEQDLAPVQEAYEHGAVDARVTVKAWPGESFPGRVDMVGASLDAETRTVKARVSVKNPEGRLKPGMFADVALDLPGSGTVITAPKDAVLEDDGRNFVFRKLEEGFFIRRPVLVGRSFADRVEILEGIEEGAEVVTDGCFLLKSDVLRSKMGAGCAD